ncbi:hypothetical protein COU59_01115 [Candidatus Pacearchaeota archaeon CG10_big_fil_rev_8_21_14_0_10_34_12]|nr:MAG: hypothetical protein COU59_01115 [Candidatus Pacearchaeota archaeon CG10_big_fil_rev_8_21_14_0_10_34_12]
MKNLTRFIAPILVAATLTGGCATNGNSTFSGVAKTEFYNPYLSEAKQQEELDRCKSEVMPEYRLRVILGFNSAGTNKYTLPRMIRDCLGNGWVMDMKK